MDLPIPTLVPSTDRSQYPHGESKGIVSGLWIAECNKGRDDDT